MMKQRALSFLCASLLAMSCSDSGSDNSGGTADATPASIDAMAQGPDAMAMGIDAAPQAGSLPSWMLRDIQPQSPMFDQTYGLSAFSGTVLVVVLLEGF